ncbi:glycosyltransferase [Luteimonas sp. TWI1437]|uniref:glycosyltransferase n=1 Tax=unclassified Luteimonas TaxID=2629088 RepID=UPI00320B3B11
MRIVVDLQGAQTASRHRGIGRYSLALLEAMLRHPREHEFWVVTNAGMAPPELDALADLLPPERILAFHSIPPTHWQDPENAWRRIASEHAREAFIRALRPDVVHISSLVEGSQDRAVTSIGRTGSLFSAATLYDLIPLHEPSYLGADWLASWYRDKIASLQRADVLLAISDHVKEDAVQRLSIPAERIVNISSAAADEFRPVSVNDELRAKLAQTYGIVGGYLMYSGAMEPRKNLERLLCAYAMLPDATRAGYQIVVSGRLSQMERDRLTLVARRLGLPPDRLVVAGHVPDPALVELYSAADLFVFPSLQEGFGLPALEAMACGAPVIGSDSSSVPEVIGRRDALFDPTDAAAIASAIERVLAEPAFAQELRAHGLRRAREFSWTSCASRALDAFESAVPTSRSPRRWAEELAGQEDGRTRLIREIADARRPGCLVSDQDMIDAAAAIAANEDVVREVHRRADRLSESLSWRVEGPFDSSYSLALVNREIARALHDLGVRVALHSTDGAGDTVPDAAFLRADPDIARLHAESTRLGPRDSDISSRLLYPPRVSDMESRFNLLHAYAWEESEIPAAWVDGFNEFLQGVSSLSTHVSKVLVDNGVGLPISICGAGVDHWDRVPDDGTFLLEARAFRFLHVSSCLPRKGVDVLLRAYGDAFTDADDVTLVIKTFANPQQDVQRLLQELRASDPGFPHVVVIEQDLDSVSLKRLYAQCHVMVAPSRAEGFGLPMAEAMLSNLAVITTGWGGQCDFCTPETSWLIDYRFEPAGTMFALSNSVWAEPSRAHLCSLLQELRRMPPEERSRRVAHGKSLLRRDFTWRKVAQRLLTFARDVANHPMPASIPELLWIGSLDPRWPMSARARAVIDGLPCRTTVLSEVRTRDGALDNEASTRAVQCDVHSTDALSAMLDRSPQAMVLIHHQRDAFAPSQLEHLLVRLMHASHKTVLVLDDPDELSDWPVSLLAAMGGCDRILVPDVEGLNVLQRHGLVGAATILPWDSFGPSFDAPDPLDVSRLWNMLRALSWRAWPEAVSSSAHERSAGAHDVGAASFTRQRATSAATRSIQ